MRNLGFTHQILVKMFTYVVKRFGLSNQMPNVNREPIGRVTQSHSCNNNMQSEREFERTFTPLWNEISVIFDNTRDEQEDNPSTFLDVYMINHKYNNYAGLANPCTREYCPFTQQWPIWKFRFKNGGALEPPSRDHCSDPESMADPG